MILVTFGLSVVGPMPMLRVQGVVSFRGKDPTLSFICESLVGAKGEDR